MTDDAPNTLFSPSFIALCFVALFGFANISIFYSFYPYLESIGIPAVWCGWLVALEPLTAFLVRPLISPSLHSGNSLTVMFFSLLGTAAALLCYPLALSIPALCLLRMVHGLSFVCLISATATLLVTVIPPGQSGKGFGIFSLCTILPFALMPPLLETLLTLVDTAAAYAWTAVLTLPALGALALLRRQLPRSVAASARRPGLRLSEILDSIRTPGVRPLLGINLGVFIASTLLFFFMKDYVLGLGMANAGLFFTVSTGATVAMRIIGAPLFDRLPRRAALTVSLVALAGSYLLYDLAGTVPVFLGAAALFGLATGMALPLIQSCMFLLSAPSMRGLNANLLLTTMDASYFIGPFAGGLLLALGGSHHTLFQTSAGLAAVAALLTGLLPAQSLTTAS